MTTALRSNYPTLKSRAPSGASEDQLIGIAAALYGIPRIDVTKLQMNVARQAHQLHQFGASVATIRQRLKIVKKPCTSSSDYSAVSA